VAIAKATIVATPWDIKIPYPPSAIRKMGRISFMILKAVFLIRTYFDDLKATNTESDRLLSVVNSAKTTKRIAKKIFSLTKRSFGEKVFINIK
jgi:hypothetical protein